MKKYTVWYDGVELADPENYRKSGLSVEDIHDLLDLRTFREPHSGERYDTLDAAKAEFDAVPVSTDVFPKGQSPYRNGHIEVSAVYLMREEYDENVELESADELDFRAEPILPDESQIDESEEEVMIPKKRILKKLARIVALCEVPDVSDWDVGYGYNFSDEGEQEYYRTFREVLPHGCYVRNWIVYGPRWYLVNMTVNGMVKWASHLTSSEFDGEVEIYFDRDCDKIDDFQTSIIERANDSFWDKYGARESHNPPWTNDPSECEDEDDDDGEEEAE